MRTRHEIETAFAPQGELNRADSFFFVGIGGAGMASLARVLHRQGKRVRGTDSTPSPLIDQMRAAGIEITIGHSPEGIQPGDAVVLTDAIDLKTSPEVARARALDLPLFRRSQVLGHLVGGHRLVAVTGTHGKTTTTGMVGAALRAAGSDPVIVVGAEVAEFGGAVIWGAGDVAAVEACEAYDSFHDLNPSIVILTNLELDHVDFHGSWENLRDSVTRFVSKIPAEGCLIYCADDAGASEVAARFKGRSIGYSAADLVDLAGAGFALRQKGPHNELNAAGALTALRELGLLSPEAVQAVAGFGGAERRQQVIYPTEAESNLGAFTLIDDYAHHPTEVAASLRAIRAGWPGRCVVVFQPHLYSRTAPMIDEFAAALSLADHVILTDIYPAREDPIPGVSSLRIAEKLTVPHQYVPSRHLLARKVPGWLQEGDVVVAMGAGNIGEFPEAFLHEMRRRHRGGKANVLVVYGGESAEREVSIHSGRAVAAGLRRLGYGVQMADLSELCLGSGALSFLTGPNRPDVAYLVTHGTGGEDGHLQGLLEMFHIPYTGSSVMASALGMNKAATKRWLSGLDLPFPKGVVIRAGDPLPDLPMPVVVKPNSQGSTAGLTFVERPEDLAAAVERGLAYDDAVLIEERVSGIEISVPVLVDRALPPVEVVPASGTYDFASKYTPGATDEICPARISEEQTALAQEYALRAHNSLGCRGVTRTDMIVMPDRIVLLEVNTLPGMTPTSLVPRSGQEAGLSFDDIVDEVVRHALTSG